ncbi:hypothetical protein DP939_29505 [Spongiactinospora rosea]|uniref:Uncharacterized protein n=1 Tax=Spongiactinospora rosea TaxID=2248750 RepID=A0A366LSD9_9ACTN|nr:hypothetical protein [Spongiactinospora rosea]RBQ16463.1 hypothetical protein DP939_29505 [Spongiactinospora rosea]
MTITDLDLGTSDLEEMFRAPDSQVPATGQLFTGKPTYVVQRPEIRNEYKKASGSSDGARTYDTTAT